MSSTNSSNNNYGTKTYFLTKKQINSSIVDAINEVKSYTDSEISNLNEDLAKELEELESKISGIETFDTQVVNELPTVGEEKVLYLIPEVDDDGNVLETKVEYIWVNDAWETIGTTRVSLKGYATEEYANRVADTAETAAKSYADVEIEEALKTAKGYTDTAEGNAKTYAEGEADQALADAKIYVNEQLTTVNENIGKKLDTETYNSDKETLNQRLIGIESTNQTQATDITNLQTAVSTKVEQEAYNSKIGDIEDVIAELPNQYAVKTLEETVTNLTKTVGDNKTAAETGIREAKDGLLDKVTNNSLTTTLASYQTRDLTITDFDTEGVQATVESVLRSNNQAIINNTSAINTITQEIVDLQQTKINQGEFWFNGGALATTNKMPLNTPFSCVWTMAMTQEEFKRHKTYFPKIIGNLGYWTDSAYGWCINNIGNTSIGIGANNGGSEKYKYNTLDIINYLDGNPHIWSVIYNGLNISLYIDNVKKVSVTFTFEGSESTNPLGIGSTPTSSYLNYGVWGKFSRIKYFNFDMSSDDAPYTIVDYINGKDESPLLNLNFNLTRESVFTQRTTDSNLTLTDSSTNVGYIKFEADSSSLAPYFWFPLGRTIKKGTRVDVSFDYKVFTSYGLLNAGFGNQNSTTISDLFSSGTNTITLSNDCDCIVFRGASGTAIQCDIRLSAFANDVLLSLNNYIINGKVLDNSQKDNHAIVSGFVESTIDSKIRTFNKESQAALWRTKSNRGELWFQGGFAKVSNMSMHGSWSLCCRIRMQTSQARYASIFHLGAFYLYWNTRLGILCSPVISNIKQISVDDNNRLANGEWHSLVVSYDGTTLKLTDETGVLLSVATSEAISISGNLLIGEVGYNGQIADIKYFNFDMSIDNAPYTIADYISGKDESPFLRIQSPSINWRPANEGTGVGNTFTFNTDPTVTSNIYLFYNQTFKGGVEYEFVFETQSSNPMNIAFDKNTYVFDVNERIATNLDTNQIETFTSTGQYIRLCNGGHNRTIVRLKCQSDFTFFVQFTISTANGSYLIVEKNQAIGALLSLADYTIQRNNTTKVVLDESGNNNHATITDDVSGAKDNNAVIQLIKENKTEITTALSNYDTAATAAAKTEAAVKSANTYTDTKILGLNLSTTYETIANVNTVKTDVFKVQASVVTINDDLSIAQTTIGKLEQDIESLKKTNSVSTYSGVYKSTSVEISNIYTNSSMVGVSGRIVVQPNLNNVAPIYIGENMTDITTAFPLYPDQISAFYFSDINNFKIACDASGDGCNYVIEWGVTNSIAIA